MDLAAAQADIEGLLKAASLSPVTIQKNKRDISVIMTRTVWQRLTGTNLQERAEIQAQLIKAEAEGQ